MSLSDRVGWVLKQLEPRRRRAYVTDTRAHIEYRDVAGEELGEFRRHVGRIFAKLGRVHWVEVNPHTRRVVITFEPLAYRRQELEMLVEEAERCAGIDQPARETWDSSHPADREPLERLGLEVSAEAAAFLLGLALRISPIPASGTASNLLGILALVRATRIKGILEERLGPERAEHVLNLLGSMAQAAAQRPISSFVDGLHKRALWHEARARRRAWIEREPELCREPHSYPLEAAERAPRPARLPRGPIEEYSDRAWVLSLASFGVSFVTTRNLQRAIGALFGALPKPARFGRDVFASELGKMFSARGLLVLDPGVLRRLDRVDCLVLQGDLITLAKFELGAVLTNGALTDEVARSQVRALFDPDRPIERQEQDGWTLGPVSWPPAEIETELHRRAIALARRGALILGLARGSQVLAIVEVKIIAQTGVEELIDAAHDAGMRVVIATSDEVLLQGLNADDVLPEGLQLKGGIRRLQRQGRCVCAVGTGTHSEALAEADCGIGLVRSGEVTPWGAHVICRNDLRDVRFILGACTMARDVAKQSVNIALGSASLGALVSAGGIVPMTTRRVLTVVNAATLVAMANGLRAAGNLDRQAVPPPRDRTPWHALEPEGVLHRLGSSERGLFAQEIVPRLAAPPRTRPAFVELMEAVTDELFNPLAPMLAAGAGLSAVVGSLTDAGMVGGVLVLNALVGGVQRFVTERAIRDLSRSSSRRAVVRRDGITQQVKAGDLVRGDVVELTPGDVVPADCRIIHCVNLEVDASSLTGESLPVRKAPGPSFEAALADRGSMLYEGTSIAAGQATAVVVAVGEETEARRAAAAAPRAATQSGVEQRLRALINLTGPVAIASGAGLVGLGLLRGRRIQEVVGAGVSLAVASVPEGLPLLATAAQLASAKRLAQRGALVRNTSSIEALGRVEVLCVDKTGTVTEGRIELHSVSDGSQEERVLTLTGERRAVLAAALRATPRHDQAQGDHVDPVDGALLRVAERLGIDPQSGLPGWQRDTELPFEPGRGYHAVCGRTQQGCLVSLKGAPEIVLRQCTMWRRGGELRALDGVALGQLHVLAGLLAHRGLRVLAVAERRVADAGAGHLERIEQLAFSGFLAFSDPVRPSAAAALERLHRAGVRTVMVTGDHPSTAKAIAAELGLLDGDVLTGSELSSLTDEELDARLDKTAVFSRVTPAQKVRVVRAFQRLGRVVAMVGDGANDAPAIRLADVGIAIGKRSTSAARGAADVVVTDERIETLVDAIVEGRAMWASVRDAVSILVGGNLGEIGFTLAGSILDGSPPLNPRQLLLVNVLTDVAPAMAVALRPTTTATLESLASEGPDASLGTALNRDIATRAAVTALGASTAWLVARATAGKERARTVGLVALVGTQLGQTLVSGGASAPVVTTSVASAAVLAGIVQTPGLSHFFGCRPLGPVGWATALGASAAATGASVAWPTAMEKVATYLKLDEVFPFKEQELGDGPEEVAAPPSRVVQLIMGSP